MNTQNFTTTGHLISEFSMESGWRLMKRFNLRTRMSDHVAQRGNERVFISEVVGEFSAEVALNNVIEFVEKNRNAGWNVRAILVAPRRPEMIIPEGVEFFLTAEFATQEAAFENAPLALVA